MLGKYPCCVCGKGVGSNSIMCKECEKWVHKKCSGIKGSLRAANGKFICKCCQAPPATGAAGKWDMEDGSEIEVMEKFCYLGDIESANGTAEVAVTNRIQCDWNTFRQLAHVLTAKDTSLTVCGGSVQ